MNQKMSNVSVDLFYRYVPVRLGHVDTILYII